MDVHFVIDGKNVTRDNWNTFGPGVTANELDRIANAVLNAAASMRCPKHSKAVSVTCLGPSLHELNFKATSCCPEFEHSVETRLRQMIRLDRRVNVEDGVWEKPDARPSTLGRLNNAFGPIFAGMVIDMVDLVTFGPMKRFLGFPAGALAGYWMASIFKLPRKQKFLLALAAGIYCVIPGLERIPVATLIGAYIRFRSYQGPETPEG